MLLNTTPPRNPVVELSVRLAGKLTSRQELEFRLRSSLLDSSSLAHRCERERKQREMDGSLHSPPPIPLFLPEISGARLFTTPRKHFGPQSTVATLFTLNIYAQLDNPTNVPLCPLWAKRIYSRVVPTIPISISQSH